MLNNQQSTVHSRIRKWGLICLLPIYGLLMAEVLLRIQEPFLGLIKKIDASKIILDVFYVYQPNPVWDHSLTPNIHRIVDRGWGPFLFQTNAQGFRHPRDLEIVKPSGIFRIFVLGDSFTEGSVPGPTVSEWIDKRLRQEHPGINFEVINAGVSSESVIPYTVRLRRQIFSFSPDLILVNIDNSDVRDDLRLLPVVKFDRRGIPLKVSQKFRKYRAFQKWLFAMENSRFGKVRQHLLLARLAWNTLFRLKEFELNLDERVISISDPEERKILKDYIWIKNKELTPNEQKLLSRWSVFVERLVFLCREKKIPVILSAYPHPEQLKPEGGRHLAVVLDNLSRELGVPYFDAYETIKESNPEALYLQEDVHFNSLGTQKWGDALGKFVSGEVLPLLKAKMGTAALTLPANPGNIPENQVPDRRDFL